MLFPAYVYYLLAKFIKSSLRFTKSISFVLITRSGVDCNGKEVIVRRIELIQEICTILNSLGFPLLDLLKEQWCGLVITKIG
jgi:hypothetical protein